MIKTYNIIRIANRYDIIIDDAPINDVHSNFYISYDIKSNGNKIQTEIVSRLNLQLDLDNLKKISNINIDNIISILDLHEDDDNYYIFWENFGDLKQLSIDDVDSTLIDSVFIGLRIILQSIIKHNIHIDVIRLSDIYIKNDSIKIMLRPQKKNKNIVFGSPIYSSPKFIRKNSKLNTDIFLENIVWNIAIIMYELSTKEIITNEIIDFNIINLNIINSNENIRYKLLLIYLLDNNQSIQDKINFINTFTFDENKKEKGVLNGVDVITSINRLKDIQIHSQYPINFNKNYGEIFDLEIA